MFFTVINIGAGVLFSLLALLSHAADATDDIYIFLTLAALVCFGTAFQLLPRQISLLFCLGVVASGTARFGDKIWARDIVLIPVARLLETSDGQHVAVLGAILLQTGLCAMYGPYLKSAVMNWVIIGVLTIAVMALVSALDLQDQMAAKFDQVIASGGLLRLTAKPLARFIEMVGVKQ